MHWTGAIVTYFGPESRLKSFGMITKTGRAETFCAVRAVAGIMNESYPRWTESGLEL